MEEQSERIKFVLSLERTKAKWRKKHSSVEFKAASDLNNELFGMPLNKSAKCKCVEDLFFMLSRLDTQKLNQINQKKMNKFILKKGKIIMLHGMATVLSEKNMTDEKAIELLTKQRGHIKSFETFPANWEELVAGEGSVDDLVPVVVSKNQIKKRAKAVGLPADATLEQVVAAELIENSKEKKKK